MPARMTLSQSVPRSPSVSRKKAAASEPGISLATLYRRTGQLGLFPGKRGNPDAQTYTRGAGNARAA